MQLFEVYTTLQGKLSNTKRWDGSCPVPKLSARAFLPLRKPISFPSPAVWS